MSYRFSLQIPVRWKDIDSFNILNNAVYLTLAEEARYGYFGHLDLLRPDGSFPFLLGEIGCRFHKPARMGMDLEIELRVARLGTKSFDMEYAISHDDEILTDLVSAQIWIDDDLRGTPIPAAARERISEFEEIPPGP